MLSGKEDNAWPNPLGKLVFNIDLQADALFEHRASGLGS